MPSLPLWLTKYISIMILKKKKSIYPFIYIDGNIAVYTYMLLILAMIDLFAVGNITCCVVGWFNIGVKIDFYASGFS